MLRFALQQFLGIKLDMNRVFGKKVIEVKGAAAGAGVHEGDLLLEVNGHVIKGNVDIRTLLFKGTEGEGCNSLKFMRAEYLEKKSTSRLRKVFPVSC